VLWHWWFRDRMDIMPIKPHSWFALLKQVEMEHRRWNCLI